MRILTGILAGIALSWAWLHYWRRFLWWAFSQGDS